MTYKTFFLPILILFIYKLNAQNIYDTVTLIPYDTLYIKDLKINNIEVFSLISDFRKNINLSFSQEEYLNELSDETGQKLIYNNSKFYFENDKLIAFVIKDSIFNITSKNIKVGNLLENIEKTFPISSKHLDLTGGKGNISITIFNKENTYSGYTLYLDIDSTNAKVISITLSND